MFIINSNLPIPTHRDGTKTKIHMKKQIKKLSLSKRTISNLNATEMNGQIGAGPTNGTCGPTKGYTCNCTNGGGTICRSHCGHLQCG